MGDDTENDLEKFGGSQDMLSIFREQVGITDVLQLEPRTAKRRGRNIGIYNRITTEEREAKYQYLFSALLINTCLLAQVVFGATLTALGAGHGSHTQITILGAANTVIAAVLTFTKGQGLPNRLRQYQCSLRKIREHIEQREREFALSDCKLNIDVEMRKIMGMYETVRQNDENNDPSTYHASTESPTRETPTTPLQPKLRSSSSLIAKLMARTEDSKNAMDKSTTKPGCSNANHSLSISSIDSDNWSIAYSATGPVGAEPECIPSGSPTQGFSKLCIQRRSESSTRIFSNRAVQSSNSKFTGGRRRNVGTG